MHSTVHLVKLRSEREYWFTAFWDAAGISDAEKEFGLADEIPSGFYCNNYLEEFRSEVMKKFFSLMHEASISCDYQFVSHGIGWPLVHASSDHIAEYFWRAVSSVGHDFHHVIVADLEDTQGIWI